MSVSVNGIMFHVLFFPKRLVSTHPMGMGTSGNIFPPLKILISKFSFFVRVPENSNIAVSWIINQFSRPPLWSSILVLHDNPLFFHQFHMASGSKDKYKSAFKFGSFRCCASVALVM